MDNYLQQSVQITSSSINNFVHFIRNNLTEMRGKRIKKKERKKSLYTVDNSRDKWPRGRTLISLRSQFSRLTDYAEVAVEYNFRRWTRPNSIWSDPRERGNGLARLCTIRLCTPTIQTRGVAETSLFLHVFHPVQDTLVCRTWTNGN